MLKLKTVFNTAPLCCIEAECQHRDEEPQPLVASLPIENSDSGHTIYSPAALGLSGFRLVPLHPIDILSALRLCLFVIGHWPLRFQAVIMNTSPWDTGLLPFSV